MQTLTSLPTCRAGRFDPPAELAALPPVVRMTYPDGHLGWLVTGYAAARLVLSDPRFSARQELRHPPVRSVRAGDATQPARPGWFVNMDGAEHGRYRRLLSGEFTVRRMALLEPRVAAIVAEHVTAMRAAGPPVDLVTAFALPVPSLVICELLGVPYADHAFFQEQTSTAVRFDTGPDASAAAMGELYGYLAGLVARGAPADSLLARLAASGELDAEELTNIALILLVAGHETTANMIGLGAFALLEHPEQLAALRAGTVGVDAAVEELLRYLTILHLGAPFRAALEDVEVAGELIRAGETVTIALPAADRDPALFGDPAALRLDRPEARRHLAFGHGIHMCLGHALARMELRLALQALLEEFPGLRLAVPSDEVRVRVDAPVLGVERLPVRWDTA